MPGERDRRWSDTMPAAYAAGLEAAVFAPFAAELAGRVAGARRVLEVAAGTGVVTRALVDAGCDVLATDLNPSMVALGAERVPRARWAQADAAAPPDGGFDLVVCGFGVMFFPDRPRAYAEARRVGGRFLFSTWDTVDTHDFAVALGLGVEAALPEDPPPFVAAVPHGYADLDRVRSDLAAAGFTDVTVDRVVRTGVAASAEALARGFCTGTPLRQQILDRGDLEETVEIVAAVMTAELGEGEVRGAMAAYLVDAR
jgi:SAM-dependent methyltransferase